MIKSTGIILAFLLLTGCALPKAPHYIDTSDYSVPTQGMAGVYYYSWKTGIYGAGYDVKFEVDDIVYSTINTGEWDYFEMKPGTHDIPMTWHTTIPVTMVAGTNYFFRGYITNFSPFIVTTYNEKEIQEALENIRSGHYEQANVD